MQYLKNKLTGNIIFTGSLLILASSIVNRIIIYALVPIYTKELSPAEFGIIGYYQAVLLVLQLAISLGLLGVQTRLYHDYKNNKETLGQLLFNINFLVFIIGFFLSVVNWFLCETIFKSLIHNSVELAIIKLLPLIAFVQTININNNGFRLVKQQFGNLFLQKVSEAGLIVLFILFFLLVRKDGALADFEGTLWGTLLCSIMFLPGYIKHFRAKVNPVFIKTALLLGLPLLLHNSASVLTNIGDRFFIKHYLDSSSLGVYTLAFQIGQAMSVVTTSLNQSWQAQFLRRITEKENYNPNKELLQIGLGNAAVGVCITAGILLFFDILFDARYTMVKTITPIIVINFLIGYLYYSGSSIIFLHKKNGVLASITISKLLVNIALNFLLIPTFGIMGAAVATIVTMLFGTAVAIVLGNKIQPNLFEITKPVIVVVAAALCILYMVFLNNPVAVVAITLLFLLASTIYFLKLLKTNDR